ncbi:5-dehydro-2-deoxygluconokinase [Streptosporangium sp. NBC_01756]|uniref:5-dehydro-2-deoxygluconokinase n=1 Tax=Streptosporangium sp. NBC_01756 TaxID=2975950 RepID=UPI002DDC88EE|nr:5-dehydro-2-deoxygluconokinase [Streptosporangium sp. NBC_01756]WSC89273.1 5-dehydro-2-deoxygluconokinase [Streptosporangium sp. NBC_01756]
MIEVLTMGRVGVDVYPLQVGVSLREVETFGKYLGGSPTNVAVAASRLGRSSAVITRTGADPFGLFVHDALRSYGVDDRYVTAVPHLPTPVTFCEIRPPEDFPLFFYRSPKAPDLEIFPEELDLPAVAAVRLFWATVTGLSQEPSRSAHFAAWRVRGRRPYTVLDLDYRPMFWPSMEAARAQVRRALGQVTVAVGNLDEVEVVTGTREPYEAGRLLLEAGVELAIVKRGGAGVLGMTPEETVEVAPVPVEVVNGLGAGDAFGGALCHGLLAGWPLADTLRFANAAGAIVAGRLACAPAMPTPEEVGAVLGTEQPARTRGSER